MNFPVNAVKACLLCCESCDAYHNFSGYSTTLRDWTAEHIQLSSRNAN